MLERLLLLEIGGLRTRGRAHPMGGVKPTPLSTAENAGSRAAVASSRMMMVAIEGAVEGPAAVCATGGGQRAHGQSISL